MASTHEELFIRDTVSITIWAIILWTLRLEPTLENSIITVLKVRRGQRTLRNRKLKRSSKTRSATQKMD